VNLQVSPSKAFAAATLSASAIAGIVTLAIPFVATSAATNSGDRLIASWRGTYETRVFQESTVLATYRGSWDRRPGEQYLGSYAALSAQSDASIDFTFIGSAVSWIGLEGPNQGKARVYVDGVYVRTVDNYSGSFRARQTLFTTSFLAVGQHTLTIEARATAARPGMSVDAFVVRGTTLDSNEAPTPKPTPTPAPSAGPKVVRLTARVTAAQFVSAVRDNTTDIIELAGGTYRPGLIRLNVDRTRPVIIRPAAGATVVFSGTGSQSAFWLGFGGVAGGITIEGLVFDGFTIGTTGLFDLGNAHDITINNITVRNVTGPVAYSWALYLESDAGIGPRNVVATNWTVDGSSRTLGAFTIEHPPGPQSVTVTGWHVQNASYAIYSANSATGVDIADWTIDSSGLLDTSMSPNPLSVVLANTTGTIRNVHATNSGGPEILPPMVDAGGNTWR